MFNKSLSPNGSVGVYESVIESTCCYCGDKIPEDELATFILSTEPQPKETESRDSKVKLYIVEVHILCTMDLAEELSNIDISSLNHGDKMTTSATILYGMFDADVECAICEKIPSGESEGIVFASGEIDKNDLGKNVWCHPNCLSVIYENLMDIDEYTEEILAEEI